MSIKISQLPAAGSIANAAIFPIVQNSTTESATISQLASFLGVGNQGPQGNQGTTGAAGPQGNQGNQGTNPTDAVITDPTATQAIIQPTSTLFVVAGAGGMTVATGGAVAIESTGDSTTLSSVTSDVAIVAGTDVDINAGSGNINLQTDTVIGDTATFTFDAFTGSGVRPLAVNGAGTVVLGSGGGTTILSNSFVSPSAGPFVFNHALGYTPLAVTFTMTNANSLGQFWLDTSNVALGYDSANVYGIASDIDVSGQIIIFG